MESLRKNYRRFIKYDHAKYVIVFLLVTFVHNFVAYPVQAAETFEPAAETDIEIIKQPDSLARTFSNLMSARTANRTDNRPQIAKDFSLVSDEPLFTRTSPTSKKASAIRLSAAEVPAGRTFSVTMTAYNSEKAQTDGDPCTTANGFNVCKHGVEDTVAANFLPLGTKIMIPDYFGNRVFVVRDRTARKYSNRVDVWMLKKSDALQFGKRRLTIVVLE